MIYLMLRSGICGHLYVYNYQHHVPRWGFHICGCEGKA